MKRIIFRRNHGMLIRFVLPFIQAISKLARYVEMVSLSSNDGQMQAGIPIQTLAFPIACTFRGCSGERARVNYLYRRRACCANSANSQ